MLVLSRKLNEQIVFPGLDVTITVISVGQNRVQIGIEAPRSIDITRPKSPPVQAVGRERISEDQVDFEAAESRSESHHTACLQFACN